MADDLTRCRECYAYVDSTSRHQAWHARINRAIDDLEDEVRKLKRR